MRFQKNSDTKICIKCGVILTNENWGLTRQKVSHYICMYCRKKQRKEHNENTPGYQDKQMGVDRNRKKLVIMAYGNKCAICNEDEYEKLTIDHIQNNGNIHRKRMKSTIYNLLYKEPLQKDKYQILCYNCNCSKNIEYKDKYNLINKKKVIEAYGGCCAECNENRIERLTIDHKNNDGAEQRRLLNCHTGSVMYRWIIKNNYPKHLGLLVLCFNCNCSKLSKNHKVLKT